MEILTYLAAVVMGMILGLIGGGGAILTVPILTYLAGQGAVEATAYSLLIVGVSALVGSGIYIRRGEMDLKTAFVFGIPSIAGVYLAREFVLPAIPAKLFAIGSLTITNEMFIMLLFAVVMLVAAVSMIRTKTVARAERRIGVEAEAALAESVEEAAEELEHTAERSDALPESIDRVAEHIGATAEDAEEQAEAAEYNYPLIVLEGLLVGGITGLVGAGGGFLIIPALVAFSNIPMKNAVGTSLMIIAMKSLLGVTASLAIVEGVVNVQKEDQMIPLDWSFLATFTGVAILGIFAGSFLSEKVPARKLKPGFGWFMMVMGIAIIVFNLAMKGGS